MEGFQLTYICAYVTFINTFTLKIVKFKQLTHLDTYDFNLKIIMLTRIYDKCYVIQLTHLCVYYFVNRSIYRVMQNLYCKSFAYNRKYQSIPFPSNNKKY